MSQLTVVYDACVLYPAPLRDLLMHLAVTDVIRARWTEEIHDEWTRNVLKNRPDLKPDQLQRTRELMNRHVRDCLITGYEQITPTLSLPDPQDRHVLAAAISCQANFIVTYNLKDFPADALSAYGVAALHPDDFLGKLLSHDAESVCVALKRQRASLRNPPKSVDEFLAILGRQNLTVTVETLRRHFLTDI